jgi:hypothetical protein
MSCPNCTPGKQFCLQCGTALAGRCSRCGAENPPSSRFCGDCGAPLDPGLPVKSSQGGSAVPSVRITGEEPGVEVPEGERKTVTALFADIKGSTELMADLDPEEARAIVDPALTVMIDAVHRYDGYIVQSTGDGIFALFGAPVAHEDHPQRALYAALRMQEGIRTYSARQVAEGGTPIEARVGVNSGEVVVRSIQTGEGHAEYTSSTRRLATRPISQRGCRRSHQPGRSRLPKMRVCWLKGTSSSGRAAPCGLRAWPNRSTCKKCRDWTPAHPAAARGWSRADEVRGAPRRR